MVELQPQGRTADAATFERPPAAASVPFPDLALHLRPDATGRRPPSIPRRLRTDAATLPVPGEEEIEAGLEDGLVRRARMRVGEGVTSGVELGEEAPRNGDVNPAKVLGEGDDLR
jgi:hypothetical protein